RPGDGQDLVVDVGDVAAERDPVPAGLQPPGQDVEADRGPQVADVRWRLHGGTAQVDRRLPGGERRELAHRARGGVMKLQRHPAKAKGYAACLAGATRPRASAARWR